MFKYFRKLQLCLLAALVLMTAGCKQSLKPGDITNSDSDTGAYWIGKLEAFKPREKNVDNKNDNAEFETFLDEVFKEGMEADYMNMHFSVSNYKALGLTKPELTLGEVEYSEEVDVSESVELLNELLAFDFNSLSYSQQYDFEVLEYSMYETIANAYYSKYGLLFQEADGIQSNLPTNFNEFVFYDQESVADYLVLLADIDRFLADCIAYTAKQAEQGIALQDSGLDATLEYIEEYLTNKENHELITSFNEKIDALSFLNDSQKSDYKKQNQEIVLNEVLPAFAKLLTDLEQFRGKSSLYSDKAGVVYYNKEYAKLMVMLEASTNVDPDELFNDLYSELMVFVYSNFEYYNDDKANEEYNAIYRGQSAPGFNSDSKLVLDYLQEKLSAAYPATVKIPYTVSPLDATTANDSILAYYLIAPVDDPDYNVIRTNPNTLSDDLASSYETLAHEGFPGHLYQNIYYARTNPHNFRSIIGFGGYTEGWAMQAELDALEWAGFESEGTAKLLGLDVYFGYVLQALADIGVNYYGWTQDELADWLANLAGQSDSLAATIYDFCINNPGVIMPYGLGLAQFVALRSEVQERLKTNFDLITYNEYCLKNGPLPFVLLESCLDEYK